MKILLMVLESKCLLIVPALLNSQRNETIILLMRALWILSRFYKHIFLLHVQSFRVQVIMLIMSNFLTAAVQTMLASQKEYTHVKICFSTRMDLFAPQKSTRKL